MATIYTLEHPITKEEPKLIARLNKERKSIKPVPSLHAYMLIKLSK